MEIVRWLWACDGRRENLAAFSHRCHSLHDKAEHLRRRRLTYLARLALGDLFTGPYREA